MISINRDDTIKDIKIARGLCRKSDKIIGEPQKRIHIERSRAACRLSKIYLGECDDPDIDSHLTKSLKEFTYSAGHTLPKCLGIYRKRANDYLKSIEGIPFLKNKLPQKTRSLVEETRKKIKNAEKYSDAISKYTKKKQENPINPLNESLSLEVVIEGYNALEGILKKQVDLENAEEISRNYQYKLLLIITPIISAAISAIITYILTK